MSVLNCNGPECTTEHTTSAHAEVFRVIDDGVCILTTMDSYKALKTIEKLIDKYDCTNFWVDFEVLK